MAKGMSLAKAHRIAMHESGLDKVQWNNKIQPKVVEPQEESKGDYYWRNYGKEGGEWLEPFKKFIDLEYKQHYIDKTDDERNLTYNEKQKLREELEKKYGTSDFSDIIEAYYKKNKLFGRK